MDDNSPPRLEDGTLYLYNYRKILALSKQMMRYVSKQKYNKLKAYKWDEALNDWVEMEAKKFDI